jgi:hypothetical protein
VLEDWHHDDDRKPSENETFVMMGQAIRSGDPADYAPTLRGNTHWRNWPEAGSL